MPWRSTTLISEHSQFLYSTEIHLLFNTSLSIQSATSSKEEMKFIQALIISISCLYHPASHPYLIENFLSIKFKITTVLFMCHCIKFLSSYRTWFQRELRMSNNYQFQLLSELYQLNNGGTSCKFQLPTKCGSILIAVLNSVIRAGRRSNTGGAVKKLRRKHGWREGEVGERERV